MNQRGDQELARLQSLSDDDLKIELGRALLDQKKGELQARPPSLKKIKDEATAWIAAKNAELQSAICSDERVKKAALSEPGARETLVKVVADVVTALAFFVPAGTVAEILVRDGLSEYCKALWTPSNQADRSAGHRNAFEPSHRTMASS